MNADLDVDVASKGVALNGITDVNASIILG